MPEPYESNCTNDWSKSTYKVKENATYSLAVSNISIRICLLLISSMSKVSFFQSCNRFCIQEVILKTCECFHPTLYQDTVDNVKNRTPCYIVPSKTSTLSNQLPQLYVFSLSRFLFTLVSDADYVCYSEILDKFDNLEINCTCNSACK